MHPIGRIRTPFRQKFGIPRQAGLVWIPGQVELYPPWDERAFFEGLETVSHLWLTFLFHAATSQGWKGRVRPPRLGGNRKLGVFATRSPFRPNHLGLSVVRLERIESHAGRRVILHVSGVDMLDGTPLLDIKPYIPYADAVREAGGGFAANAPAPRLEVRFSPAVERQLATLEQGRELGGWIEQLIALDPRPAYAAGSDLEKEYGMHIANLDVRWVVDDQAGRATVVALARA